jgi:hypothetical protein
MPFIANWRTFFVKLHVPHAWALPQGLHSLGSWSHGGSRTHRLSGSCGLSGSSGLSGIWSFRLSSSWALGHSGSWALGLLGSLALGLMGARALGHCTGISGSLNFINKRRQWRSKSCIKKLDPKPITNNYKYKNLLSFDQKLLSQLF